MSEFLCAELSGSIKWINSNVMHFKNESRLNLVVLKWVGSDCNARRILKPFETFLANTLIQKKMWPWVIFNNIYF